MREAVIIQAAGHGEEGERREVDTPTLLSLCPWIFTVAPSG